MAHLFDEALTDASPNLRRRADLHRNAYRRHVIAVVGADRLRAALAEGDPAYGGRVWGTFEGMPTELRWLAQNPMVAPVLAQIPVEHRAAMLAATQYAVERTFRIPKETRALAERRGMEHIPRRNNPLASQVNRKNVGTEKSPWRFLYMTTEEYVRTHYPATARWLRKDDDSYGGKEYRMMLQLAKVVHFALSCPEGFPPAPHGDMYTPDEVYAILNLYVNDIPEWAALYARAQKYAVNRHTGVERLTGIPSENDLIKSGEYAFKHAVETEGTVDPLTAINAAFNRVQQDIAYYNRRLDGIDRLGSDWIEKLDTLRYANQRVGALSARKILEIAHEVETLAGADLLPDIINHTFHHSDRNRYGGYNATLTQLMANSLDAHAEYERQSAAHEQARQRDLAVLLPALKPLLDLQRPITLRDVSARLPPGFTAATRAHEGAYLQFPSGYRPYESQGDAKWDRLVRRLFAPSWRQ